MRLCVGRRRRIGRISDVDRVPLQRFPRSSDSPDLPADSNQDQTRSGFFHVDVPRSLEEFTRGGDIHLQEKDFIERGWFETEEELFELED